MKRMAFIFTAFVLFSCGGSDVVEVGQKTTMAVELTKDVGTVVRGEKVEAKIEVVNTGDYPLVIADVSPSCSCTIASKPEEPIQPGEKAIISATVDTEKISSKQIKKSVYIVANTEPSTTLVSITGKIKN